MYLTLALLDHNGTVQGKKFEDRACCEIGGDVPSDMCPASTGLIIGIVVAVVAAIVLLICLWKRKSIQDKMQRCMQPGKADAETGSNTDLPLDNEPEQAFQHLNSSINESVSIVMHPGAAAPTAPPSPSVSPAFNAKK